MKTRLLLQRMLGLGIALASSAALAAGGEPQLSSSSDKPVASAATDKPASNAAPATVSTTTTSLLPPGAYVSPWLLDIIKLTQAHIDQSVSLMFVDSAGTFNLDADQIIYLRDVGISPDLITAMLQHDAEIFSGLRPLPSAPSATRPGTQLIFAAAPAQTAATKPAASNTNSVSTPAPLLEEPITPAQPPEQVQSNDAPEPVLANEEEFAQPMPSELPARHVPSEIPTMSPVRKPYPVPLTDPIIMVRGEGRVPNVFVIQLFP